MTGGSGRFLQADPASFDLLLNRKLVDDEEPRVGFEGNHEALRFAHDLLIENRLRITTLPDEIAR